MDGVHDLGGLHGFGAVPIDDTAPLFRERWEGRVWAMAGVVTRSTTTDRFRWTIEQLPPAQYLASSYYERWLWAIERLAAERAEATGPWPRVARPAPNAAAPAGKHRPGDRVRVLGASTAGHTRVPRYLRRHSGVVAAVAFRWPNPTISASDGSYGPLEAVYTVSFAAADLFGPDADHTLTADIAESDLEDA